MAQNDSSFYKKMITAATKSQEKITNTNSAFFALYHNELWFDYNLNVAIINHLAHDYGISKNSLTQVIIDIICLYSCNMITKLSLLYSALNLDYSNTKQLQSGKYI